MYKELILMIFMTDVLCVLLQLCFNFKSSFN